MFSSPSSRPVSEVFKPISKPRLAVGTKQHSFSGNLPTKLIPEHSPIITSRRIPKLKHSPTHENKEEVNPFKERLTQLYHSVPKPPSNLIQAISMPDMIKTTEYEIKLQLLSNYGHPSKITCAKIDVLNSDQLPIPIKIAYLPPYKHTSNLLTPLFSGSLFKGDNDPFWEMKWPPLGGYIEINIIIVSQQEPTFMRLWPNLKEPEANIKDIHVLFDGIPVYKGTLSDQTGSIFPLAKPLPGGPLLFSVGTSLDIMRKSDKYGILPIQPVQELVIKIISSYNGAKQWGLSFLRLFDLNGEPIDIRKHARFAIKDAGELDGEEDSLLTENDTVVIGKLTPTTKIFIIFNKPTPVSAVEIFNAFDGKAERNIGVEKCSIYTDNNLRWVGKVPMRTVVESMNVLAPKLVMFTADDQLFHIIYEKSRDMESIV